MNGDDQGPLMYGSVAAALVSATVFTAARVYCSVVMLNRTRREDVIIVLSLIFLWAGSILVVLAVHSGIGRHGDTLTVEQRAGARFYYVVSVWPCLLAITVPKVAVAGLIIQIFTPDVWTRTIMSVVVCLGVANNVVISALSTFQCQPLAAAWDPRVRAVRCVSTKIYLNLCYFTSSYSASVDFYLAIYPALVFRKMGFSIIKKIALSVVLGLGIVVTAVACLKTSYLYVVAKEDFTSPRLQ
ncbi:putative integral membrane protein [Diaporthe ampelina]|uniref:Putative integral membrane protein n=1 Tax=Diaporthe ampelina TaxID=1214573 RepID=A0A0G2IGM3_9PEZI|nr:putative integral membrane protein [Diaporthe ampelina]